MCEVRELGAEPQLEVHVGVIVEVILEMVKMSADLWIRARSQEHDLRVMGQRLQDRVVDQVHALLAIQAADVGEKRLVRVTQHEPFT